jgi:hypothetical protein
MVVYIFLKQKSKEKNILKKVIAMRKKEGLGWGMDEAEVLRIFCFLVVIL